MPPAKKRGVCLYHRLLTLFHGKIFFRSLPLLFYEEEKTFDNKSKGDIQELNADYQYRELSAEKSPDAGVFFFTSPVEP